MKDTSNRRNTPDCFVAAGKTRKLTLFKNGHYMFNAYRVWLYAYPSCPDCRGWGWVSNVGLCRRCYRRAPDMSPAIWEYVTAAFEEKHPGMNVEKMLQFPSTLDVMLVD